jgi:hypothetical protein
MFTRRGAGFLVKHVYIPVAFTAKAVNKNFSGNLSAAYCEKNHWGNSPHRLPALGNG